MTELSVTTFALIRPFLLPVHFIRLSKVVRYDDTFRMFHSVMNYTKHDVNASLSELSRVGILPRSIPLETVSNDRLETLYDDGSRHLQLERNIGNSTYLRVYWTKHFKMDNCSVIFQRILEMLPGKSSVCERCDWSLPSLDFYSETCCSYCNYQTLDIALTIKESNRQTYISLKNVT